MTFGSCIVESIDGEHNHPAYNDAEIIFKSARSDLIESGKQSSKLSAQSICIVAVSNLIKEHNLDPTDPDVSKAATIIKSIQILYFQYYDYFYNYYLLLDKKSSINWHRLNLVPTLFDEIEEINLPEEYKLTNYKKLFMQFQNKDMIGFSSPTGLEILNQSEWWAADGTFKVFIYLYLSLFQCQI